MAASVYKVTADSSLCKLVSIWRSCVQQCRGSFYPRNVMDLCICMSVRVSVCHNCRYCIETAARIELFFRIQVSSTYLYTLFRGNSGISKNRNASIWSFFPNYGLGQISFATARRPSQMLSIVDRRLLITLKCPTLCTTRWARCSASRAGLSAAAETWQTARFCATPYISGHERSSHAKQVDQSINQSTNQPLSA